MRVPVTIRHSWFVPTGAAAWVPRPRLILFARGQEITERLLAHELRHVEQAERHPWPSAYVTQWLLTGLSYRNMRFEREARAAEQEPYYLTWARDLIAGMP